MTLITEDGTGLSTSESYASVSAADTRLAALGTTAWAALNTTAKEQALRRATQHMEQAYRSRWKGTRLMRAQALSWPRYGAESDGFYIDSTVIPAEVVNACIDLASKATTAELAPDQTRGVIRKKIGPLETEYEPHGLQGTRYVAIDRMLAPLLTGSAVMAQVVRT